MLNILSLGGTDASWSDLKKWIEGKKPQLPAGCLLDVEIEARDLIAQFIQEDRRLVWKPIGP